MNRVKAGDDPRLGPPKVGESQAKRAGKGSRCKDPEVRESLEEDVKADLCGQSLEWGVGTTR